MGDLRNKQYRIRQQEIAEMRDKQEDAFYAAEKSDEDLRSKHPEFFARIKSEAMSNDDGDAENKMGTKLKFRKADTVDEFSAVLMVRVQSFSLGVTVVCDKNTYLTKEKVMDYITQDGKLKQKYADLSSFELCK